MQAFGQSIWYSAVCLFLFFICSQFGCMKRTEQFQFVWMERVHSINVKCVRLQQFVGNSWEAEISYICFWWNISKCKHVEHITLITVFFINGFLCVKGGVTFSSFLCVFLGYLFVFISFVWCTVAMGQLLLMIMNSWEWQTFITERLI